MIDNGGFTNSLEGLREEKSTVSTDLLIISL